MHCVILNISPRARPSKSITRLRSATFSPDDANHASIVHECRITWIKKNRIGLTFVETA